MQDWIRMNLIFKENDYRIGLKLLDMDKKIKIMPWIEKECECVLEE